MQKRAQMAKYAKIRNRISELTGDYMMCDQNPSCSFEKGRENHIKLAGLIFALAKKAVLSAPADKRPHAIHVWASWHKRITRKNY